MLVLPTTKNAPQTDDLDLSDITAAWSVLRAFDAPQLVIYNGGPAAGSSLGHKHLQMLSLPDDRNMSLFPSLAKSETEIARSLPNVPFKHFVYRIPAGASPSEVFQLYEALLIATRRALKEFGATDSGLGRTFRRKCAGDARHGHGAQRTTKTTLG